MLATQNRLSRKVHTRCPGALDRFFFKLIVGYSDRQELKTILDRTTTGYKPEVQHVLTGEQIIAGQNLVKPRRHRRTCRIT